ncbi:MAG: hypothetical protein WBK77_08910 [Alphaproteobacteria bacterium]
MKNTLMLTAAIFVMSAPFAFAEEGAGGPHKGMGMMEKLDADKDNEISKEEFMKFQEERFAEIDKDANGKISKPELEAKQSEWKEKMKELRAQRAAAKGKKSVPPEAPAEAPAQ